MCSPPNSTDPPREGPGSLKLVLVIHFHPPAPIRIAAHSLPFPSSDPPQRPLQNPPHRERHRRILLNGSGIPQAGQPNGNHAFSDFQAVFQTLHEVFTVIGKATTVTIDSRDPNDLSASSALRTNTAFFDVYKPFTKCSDNLSSFADQSDFRAALGGDPTKLTLFR